MKIFFSLFFLIAAPVSLFAQTSDFERLKSKFENGLIFTANYDHVYMDSYTRDTVRSTGQIWIGENTYKVISNDQIIVVDGETSRVYDRYRNRVIISRYDPAEDDFAPSRMLNGSNTNFSVEETNSGSGSQIIMVSEDDFSTFQRIEIQLSQQNMPTEILALDFADNKIVTGFEGGRFIENNPSVFELEFPADAEIIDMRAQ